MKDTDDRDSDLKLSVRNLATAQIKRSAVDFPDALGPNRATTVGIRVVGREGDWRKAADSGVLPGTRRSMICS